MRGNFRLSPEQVVEILRLRKLGWRQVDLAARFGISQPQISDICNRRSWKNDLLREALRNSALIRLHDSNLSSNESDTFSAMNCPHTAPTEAQSGETKTC